jgi:hypothetical protein
MPKQIYVFTVRIARLYGEPTLYDISDEYEYFSITYADNEKQFLKKFKISETSTGPNKRIVFYTTFDQLAKYISTKQKRNDHIFNEHLLYLNYGPNYGEIGDHTLIMEQNKKGELLFDKFKESIFEKYPKNIPEHYKLISHLPIPSELFKSFFTLNTPLSGGMIGKYIGSKNDYNYIKMQKTEHLTEQHY